MRQANRYQGWSWAVAKHPVNRQWWVYERYLSSQFSEQVALGRFEVWEDALEHATTAAAKGWRRGQLGCWLHGLSR